MLETTVVTVRRGGVGHAALLPARDHPVGNYGTQNATLPSCVGPFVPEHLRARNHNGLGAGAAAGDGGVGIRRA